MVLRRPVLVVSQPKAGTYLLANVLMELGFDPGPDGIMHIGTGKIETYPLPGKDGYNDARKNPSLVRQEQWWGDTVKQLSTKPNRFAVGHLPFRLNKRYFDNINVILLTRPIDQIKQSLERWDQISGRTPANHSKVINLAKDILNWKHTKKFWMQDNFFKLSFSDMKDHNIGRIDQLQKFVGIDPIQDSGIVLSNALRKPSLTKV